MAPTTLTELLARPDVVEQCELRSSFGLLAIHGGGLEQMTDVIAMGGGIAFLGIPPAPMTVDWSKIVFKSLTIKGIYGREMYETWYMMTVMLQSGLDIAPVITHRFPSDRFDEAFAAIRTGETGKVLLHWTDGP